MEARSNDEVLRAIFEHYNNLLHERIALRETWAAVATYVEGDIVQHRGISYEAMYR